MWNHGGWVVMVLLIVFVVILGFQKRRAALFKNGTDFNLRKRPLALASSRSLEELVLYALSAIRTQARRTLPRLRSP
jgi:hypothetical protein